VTTVVLAVTEESLRCCSDPLLSVSFPFARPFLSPDLVYNPVSEKMQENKTYEIGFLGGFSSVCL
jgi:hypothetical protein